MQSKVAIIKIGVVRENSYGDEYLIRGIIKRYPLLVVAVSIKRCGEFCEYVTNDGFIFFEDELTFIE